MLTLATVGYEGATVSRFLAALHAAKILESIVQSGRRVALLCFEADPSHCHRSLLVDAMTDHMQLRVNHLIPVGDDDAD
jgi:uncharacterized protein (DUF488 family)